MANTTFFSLADLGLQVSSDEYLQQWLATMQANFPNYSPSSGNLEYILAQIFASWAASSASLASFGSTNLFQTFGTQLVNLPPLAGESATALVSISTSPLSTPAIAVLSTALTTGGAITTLLVNPLLYDIPAGTITVTSGANTQNWITTGAGVGATSIPVSSQTPNFAYPIGSNITGTADYTLDAGTQFDLDGYGFATISSTDIAAGASLTIPIYGVEASSDYNGAGQGGDVSAISAIDWLSSVSLVAPASGGIDPEDSTAYLNRLAATLQTMAQRPITANDYATIALNFVPQSGTDQQEVGRAAAIDGAQLASPIERSVTVYVTDANGNPLNADTLAALEAYFTALREINFIVNVVNPAYQPVYVTCQIIPTAGYTASTVASNVQSAVVNWLSPANWGTAPPYGIAGTWATTTVTVYESQLEAIIQNAQGVDHIIDGSLKLGGTPNPTGTTDYMLPGVATLPIANATSVPIAGATTSTVLGANTSTLLSTGGAITSIPVKALGIAIGAGSIILTDPTGAHTQTFTTAGAAVAATAIPVTSATPNFAYPIGSLITNGAITSIPVNALANPILAGTTVLTDPTAAHTQTWTTTGAVVGATLLPVTSATPNFAYPAGSTFTGPGIYVV